MAIFVAIGTKSFALMARMVTEYIKTAAFHMLGKSQMIGDFVVPDCFRRCSVAKVRGAESEKKKMTQFSIQIRSDLGGSKLSMRCQKYLLLDSSTLM